MRPMLKRWGSTDQSDTQASTFASDDLLLLGKRWKLMEGEEGGDVTAPVQMLVNYRCKALLLNSKDLVSGSQHANLQHSAWEVPGRRAMLKYFRLSGVKPLLKLVHAAVRSRRRQGYHERTEPERSKPDLRLGCSTPFAEVSLTVSAFRANGATFTRVSRGLAESRARSLYEHQMDHMRRPCSPVSSS